MWGSKALACSFLFKGWIIWDGHGGWAHIGQFSISFPVRSFWSNYLISVALSILFRALHLHSWLIIMLYIWSLCASKLIFDSVDLGKTNVFTLPTKKKKKKKKKILSTVLSQCIKSSIIYCNILDLSYCILWYWVRQDLFIFVNEYYYPEGLDFEMSEKRIWEHKMVNFKVQDGPPW